MIMESSLICSSLDNIVRDLQAAGKLQGHLPRTFAAAESLCLTLSQCCRLDSGAQAAADCGCRLSI